MKIVLVNPPTPHIESFLVLGITVPPLGLAYLAAVLEAEGHSVKIIDASALGMSMFEIKREIERNQPEIVGVTSTTPTIREALATLRTVKDVCPDAVTVLGGPHISFLTVETMGKCAQLDVSCVGEGEMTMLDLVRAVKRKASLSDVRGIAYRSNGSVKKTQPRPPISDLDGLPFPARHLLPMDRYSILGKKSTIGNIITSRGCPYSCVFCESSLLFGRRFRARSPKNVVDEMEQVIAEYKPKTIEFSDDLFTLNRRRAEAICDEIKRRGLDIPWACSSRVDTISPKLLQKMKEAGCMLIYYGVESGSQRILNQMGKGISVKQVMDAVKRTREAGIETLASFILGFPGETMNDIAKTIAFAKKLDIEYAQFSFATPYPGTELYNIAKEKGLLITEDWSEYTAGKPIIATNGCTKKDLKRIFMRAYKSFYLSPRTWLLHLRKGRLSFFLQAVQLAFRQAL
ncbi:radical SAM protein [Candidatus Bathyarchaeota archaeon]|nr:radical SAM protein [Candidatus Bathyarchaeota archaeon]